MISIESGLDLGNDLTLETYWKAINELRENQKQYNALLPSVDGLYNELLADERAGDVGGDAELGEGEVWPRQL